MNINDYDYDLPPELIAQSPLKDRTSSRLMVLNPSKNKIEHRHFNEIVNYFHSGDTLVLNNTKVIKARMFGIKMPTGAKIELLLLSMPDNNGIITALVGNAKAIKIGTIIDISNIITATCLEIYNEGIMKFKLTSEIELVDAIDKIGNLPLPPYIKEKLEDESRYQTVYATTLGSAAAPTAGLHFTEELLETLTKKGIEVLYLTLHVGLGTFRPIKSETIEEHQMHSEYYELSQEVAVKLNQAKKEKRRIFAVGTTSLRALESNYLKNHYFTPEVNNTNIFIYPPQTIKSIDGLITNFHLPKSTLLLLVSALAGKNFILDAYSEAIKEKYRFFSFGDASLIFNKSSEIVEEDNSYINSLNSSKDKLLLHTCCAVCLTKAIDLLDSKFEVVSFYYNNNIQGKEEFDLRRNEVARFINLYNQDFNKSINLIELNYQPTNFITNLEGNYGCFNCIKQRLLKTRDYALENGYKYFSTTLTSGPSKSAIIINRIGRSLEMPNIRFIPANFKKDLGVEKEKFYNERYKIYHQNYCGCKRI